MKVKGRKVALYDEGNPGEPKWFEVIDPETTIDKLPVVHSEKGCKRIAVPVFQSTELLAAKLHEARPDLYRVQLDAYRSMMEIGKQVLSYCYSKTNRMKLGKAYKFHIECEKILAPAKFLEIIQSQVEKLAEMYGKELLSRDVTTLQRDKLRAEIPPEFQEKFDQIWENQFENNEEIAKMKNRLRQREWRKRNKAVEFPSV